MECKGSHTIFFNLNKKGQIEVKCCPFKQEITQRVISISDLLNHSNILDFANEVHSIHYNNNEVIRSECYPEEYCDWCNDKIDNICVSLLRNEDETERKNYFEFLNKIKKLNLNSIRLTDISEPFLYKEDTFNFLKSLKSNISTIEIKTDTLYLDKNDIEQLGEIKNDTKVDIQIYVDAPAISSETYEEITGKDSFGELFENINLLNSKGLLKTLNIRIERLNFEELPFMVNFWEDAGLSFEQINFYPKYNEDDEDETEEAQELINEIIRTEYIKKGYSVEYLDNIG